MLVATSEGVGGAVDGTSAETLLWSPQGVELISLFKSPWRNQLQPGGGSAIVPASGSDTVLAPDEVQADRRRRAEDHRDLRAGARSGRQAAAVGHRVRLRRAASCGSSSAGRSSATISSRTFPRWRRSRAPTSAQRRRHAVARGEDRMMRRRLRLMIARPAYGGRALVGLLALLLRGHRLRRPAGDRQDLGRQRAAAGDLLPLVRAVLLHRLRARDAGPEPRPHRAVARQPGALHAVLGDRGARRLPRRPGAAPQDVPGADRRATSSSSPPTASTSASSSSSTVPASPPPSPAARQPRARRVPAEERRDHERAQPRARLPLAHPVRRVWPPPGTRALRRRRPEHPTRARLDAANALLPGRMNLYAAQPRAGGGARASAAEAARAERRRTIAGLSRAGRGLPRQGDQRPLPRARRLRRRARVHRHLSRRHDRGHDDLQGRDAARRSASPACGR